MSGIFGVVRWAADIADERSVREMAAATQSSRSVSAATRVYGGAAFGGRSTPIVDAGQDVLVVASARVDNQRHVAAALDRAAPHQGASDADLLIRAYLAWGPSCADRVFGDWSLAAWHRRDRRLTLLRDHSGNTALFWHRDPESGTCWFASDRGALRACGVRRRLNEERLAATLTSWTAADPHATIDADIERVPPAHVVSMTDRSVERRRYWFPERLHPWTGGTPDEYARGLRSVLDEATRSRCRGGDVAVTLSGGLDSGAVAALAARELHGSGRALTGYTHVPIRPVTDIVGPNRFGDEGPLATATAEFIGIDRHVLLDSRDVSPIAGIRRMLRAHDEPGHAAANAFWIVDLLTTAAATDRVLLTGQGGNATISWTGRPSALTLAGRLRSGGVRRALGYGLPIAAQRRRVKHVLRGIDWENSAIDAGFARRLDLAARIADGVGRLPGLAAARATPIELRAVIAQPGSSRIGEVWAANSDYFGIEVRDPTLDPRVVEFAWRVPDEIYRPSASPDRALIRAAMRGLLPDVARLNTDRGRQSADLIHRLRQVPHEVEAALGEVAASSAAEFVSVAKLRRTWRTAQSRVDPATTHQTGSILLRGMMAGLWLAQTYG